MIGPKIHPIIIFSAVILGSMCIWLLMPIEWLNEWKIESRASYETVLKTSGLAWLSFSTGCLIAWYFGTPRQTAYFETEQKYLSYLWFCSVFAVLAFCIVVILTIQLNGLDGLIANMRGAGRPLYITGLTTFLHLTTVGGLLYGVIRINRAHWRSIRKKQLFTYLGICIYLVAAARAIIGAERLALYLPFTGVALCYVILAKPSIGKIVKVGGIAIVLVLGAFIMLESQRSYSVKYRDGQTSENVIIYGLKRFMLYYALAVNTGAARVEYSEQGIMTAPLFTTTAYPLGRLVYSSTALGSLMDIDYQEFERLGAVEGVYNVEFTNVGGIFSPFAEGLYVGLIFWAFWGGSAMWFYLRAYRKGATGYDVATYALILTALFDAPRVSLFGATHFLFPYAFLLLFRMVGPIQMLLRRPQIFEKQRRVMMSDKPSARLER